MKPTQPNDNDGVETDVPPNHALLNPPRRNFLRVGPALAAALALPATALEVQPLAVERWVATWGTAPAGPPPTASTMVLANQTLRLIVHASVGGSRARIRISNEMGSAPLSIGAARIALRSSGATLVAGTDRQLLFGGRASATIAAGAAVLSDPVTFNVPPFSDLAISLYLPATTRITTLHDLALQTGYVSYAGNYSANSSMSVRQNIYSWPFLTEVDVSGAYSGLSATAAFAALGDSITDGLRSTSNANRRWPDMLARRLQLELGVSGNIGAVNRGIAANSLLKTYPEAGLTGQRALDRFDRDVAGTTGVRWMFVLIGINDIVYSSGTNPIPASSLITGHQQLVAKARARGVRAIGATLTPFEGHAYYTAARENVRKNFNAWMRSSGTYDAVVDFELALRDPARITRLRAAYDSGDHLHPNDAGYQAMAQAVPLTIFTQL